jgi:uncharacterized protein DUF2188
MNGNVHVVPSARGWDVKVEGGGEAGHFHTQDEAIAASRGLALVNRSEHIVHDRDGRVRQRDSYERDPFPRKG